MKKIFLLLSFAFIFNLFSVADEGMWIPLFIKNNESRMKGMGMKISADDIYSTNHSSLKDAVVLFGRGCTGELISDEGLLITNHHCGYSQIQAHSTLENDYLKNGFWAQNRKEELVNKGLTVTFLVRMEDVTDLVLRNVDPKLTEAERAKAVEKNIKKICDEAVKGTHYQAVIKDFYNGNQYFLFVNEVFKDVRLVGAPPSSIGKFGGDADNWMWPRHTGDFSIFRIYAGKDNKPAEYAPDNVPYKPAKSFPVSIKGVEKGDFTFVYGFPGTTNQFATSYEVELIKELENPIAINMRDMRLKIIDARSKGSDLIRIQYAAKYANIANGWKKWIGENRGLQKLRTIDNKKKFEQAFEEWSLQNDALKKKYYYILPMYKDIYTQLYNSRRALKYFIEAGLGSEIIGFAWKFNNLVKLSHQKNADAKEIEKAVQLLQATTEEYFKNYDLETDRLLFINTMKAYYNSYNNENLPAGLAKIRDAFKEDFNGYTDFLFSKSALASKNKTMALLDGYQIKKLKKIEKDPAFVLASSLFTHYFDKVYPDLIRYEDQLDSLNRIYLQGLIEMQNEKTFYPDANLTLRVTYGKVDDYFPFDTTLDGIFEKEKLEYDDYQVHPKLRELYNARDFGRYGKNNTMPVCFIASNHTTGGNSGSPVINAEGQLIGINFDRNWEGTMSDLNYDASQCRNISLDMRYVLFIIDKFAGAGHLIDEMKIVQ